MRVCDLIEILDKFRTGSNLGDCNVRIAFADKPNKQYKIKEMAFAPNRIIGAAEKWRMVIYIEND
jgi:hypothetical protein